MRKRGPLEATFWMNQTVCEVMFFWLGRIFFVEMKKDSIQMIRKAKGKLYGYTRDVIYSLKRKITIFVNWIEIITIWYLWILNRTVFISLSYFDLFVVFSSLVCNLFINNAVEISAQIKFSRSKQISIGFCSK